MPYDPRPVSEGGNRNIDETWSRCAPAGKYRVVGVDTFDGTDWIEGDFDSKDAAVKHADEKGAKMLKTHVYDERGDWLHSAGEF